MKKTAFLIALLALSCATPYKKQNSVMGLLGGYSDARLDEDVFRVSFRGNGYTSKERVVTFLLYRCAEVTKEAGYDHFILLAADTAGNDYYYQTSPGYYSGTTVGAGRYATVTRGTYNPAQHVRVTKYGSTVIIKLGKGEKPDNPAAFSAASMLKYLRDEVH